MSASLIHLDERSRQLMGAMTFLASSERQSCPNLPDGLLSTQNCVCGRDEFVDLLLLPDERGKEPEGGGSGGKDEDAALLQRSQCRGDAFLELDPDHHAAAAHLADLVAADGGEAIDELRAERRRPRVEIAFT